MTFERNNPTLRDYERQAEATRHRLSDTLKELHVRLTPGDMLNEVLSYARGGGGTFFRALTNATRENPVPSLLIGAGCAMFLADRIGITRRSVPTGNGHSTTGPGYPRKGADAVAAGAASVQSAFGGTVDIVKDQASSLAANARDRAASMGGTISDAAGSVSDTVSGAAQQLSQGAHYVRDKVSGAVDQMKQTARGVGETVQDYSASIGERVTDAADQTRQQGPAPRGKSRTR